MNLTEDFFRYNPVRDTRLVGHDNQLVAKLFELDESRGHTIQQLDLLRVIDIARIINQRVITV